MSPVMHIREFFKSSLKNRIIAIIVLISILPFTIIYTYVFFSLKNSYTQDYVNATQEKTGNFSELVNRKLLEYVQKSKYISTDRYIIENLNHDFGDSIEDKAAFYVSTTKLLEDIGVNESGDQSRYTIYYSNRSLFGYKYFKDIAEIETDDFIQNTVLKGTASDIVWSPDIRMGQMGEKYFSLYKRIPTISTNSCILEIKIPFSVIELFLINMDVPSGSAVIYQDTSGGSIFITGKEEMSQAETGNGFESKDYILLENTLINSHKLIVALPKSGMYMQFVNLSIILVLVFLLMIVGISLAAVFTTNSITRELKRFISQIKKEDDLLMSNTTIEVSGDDEVSLIKRKFSDLIKKLNVLHNENMDSFKNRKILEVELLRSKLNPHMLYNSLSVIKWGAINNSDKKTVELVDCMTRYYRSVLNKGYDIVQIKDEIKLIKEYVRINEIAHAAEYNLEVNIEEDIMDCHIIKLLLQPIVENAISHGLNGKKGEKKIIINGKRTGNDIHLSVEDNGYGMKAETIEKILKLEYKKAIGGYGMKNILTMIKTYFGEEYGIGIESEIGIFTRVSIKIPANVDLVITNI